MDQARPTSPADDTSSGGTATVRVSVIRQADGSDQEIPYATIAPGAPETVTQTVYSTIRAADDDESTIQGANDRTSTVRAVDDDTSTLPESGGVTGVNDAQSTLRGARTGGGLSTTYSYIAGGSDAQSTIRAEDGSGSSSRNGGGGNPTPAASLLPGQPTPTSSSRNNADGGGQGANGGVTETGSAAAVGDATSSIAAAGDAASSTADATGGSVQNGICECFVSRHKQRTIRDLGRLTSLRSNGLATDSNFRPATGISTAPTSRSAFSSAQSQYTASSREAIILAACVISLSAGLLGLL